MCTLSLIYRHKYEVYLQDVIVGRAELGSVSSADGPPPYSQLSGAPVASSSSPNAHPAPAVDSPSSLPPVKPSNFLTQSRLNSSIRGQYVVDPLLPIPPAVLAELPEGEVRRNLSLETKNGAINAEIWVVNKPREDSPGKQSRTTLNVSAWNGSVTVKMVRYCPAPHCVRRLIRESVILQRTLPEGNTPFHLTATSKNGSVTVHVPRTFCGTVSAYTKNGSVSWSNALQPHVTIFSEVSNRCGTRY
jgi:hypothetical protein